jgi:hypothetical protein
MTSRTLQNSIILKSSEHSSHTCEFCQKTFAREGSLLKHMCEQRRRYQQRHEPAVQLALRAFQEFYSLALGKHREIPYAEFCRSNYYLAFVRFGHYLRKTHVIDPQRYTHWLIRNNIKIDVWCSDKTYERWLKQYLLVENPHDALSRSILTMTAWAEKNSVEFSGYFRYGNNNEIINSIMLGQISAWCVYCCESGRQFLERINSEQLNLILEYVNPSHWTEVLERDPEETAWMKQTLASAGL